MAKKKILVTGASGFLGFSLCRHLISTGHDVIGLTRSNGTDFSPEVAPLQCDLETSTLDSTMLQGIDCIVHLAGQAHGKGGKERQELEHFRRVNVELTLRLAEAALGSGVRRFIFVSSIGVHGSTTGRRAISEDTPFNPESPYAISKMEAELALMRLFGAQNKCELTIVRPPLVYGSHAPGNFGKLLKISGMGIPLPLGHCSNRRNVISLSHLVDFLAVCIDHPAAGNESFVVAEASAVSTREMVRALRAGMQRSSGLLPVPSWIMFTLFRAVGRQDMYTQLFRDLEVDASKARNILGWAPGSGTVEQLAQIGRRYADSLN